MSKSIFSPNFEAITQKSISCDATTDRVYDIVSRCDVSIPHTDSVAREDISNMSFVISLQYEKATYFAADSISSYTAKNKQFCNGSCVVVPNSHAYEKILLVPINGAPLVALFVGTNQLGINKLTVRQVIDGIDFSERKNNCRENFLCICEQITKEILSFAPPDIGMRLCSYIEKNNLEVFELGKDEKSGGKYSTTHKTSTVPNGEISRYYAGVDWARLVSDYMYFPEYDDKDDVLSSLRKLFLRIKKVRPYFNDSVGGPIRILKLTPDSAEWLQNKPE